MTDFVSASQVRPDIISVLRYLYYTIEENPDCTQHMLQGVLQLLRSVYHLPLNPLALELFNGKMNRLHRWVVQWQHRLPIDEAIEDLRRVFHDTVAWCQRQDIQNNPAELERYLENAELIQAEINNTTVPTIIREARTQEYRNN